MSFRFVEIKRGVHSCAGAIVFGVFAYKMIFFVQFLDNESRVCLVHSENFAFSLGP